MFQHWANALAIPAVRISLGLLGVLATIALGPMSVLGTFMLLTTPFSDAQDKYMFLGWSVVGTCGVVAISAAWLRLLLPRRYFQERPVLKWATAVGLLVGLLTASVLLANPAMAWLVAPTIPVGLFLLGATIGEASPPSKSVLEPANHAL